MTISLEELLAERDFTEATHLFYEEVWVPAKPDRYPPPGTEVEFRDGYFSEELETVPGCVQRHYLSKGHEYSTIAIVGKGRHFINAVYDPNLSRGGTWRPKPAEKTA